MESIGKTRTISTPRLIRSLTSLDCFATSMSAAVSTSSISVSEAAEYSFRSLCLCSRPRPASRPGHPDRHLSRSANNVRRKNPGSGCQRGRTCGRLKKGTSVQPVTHHDSPSSVLLSGTSDPRFLKESCPPIPYARSARTRIAIFIRSPSAGKQNHRTHPDDSGTKTDTSARPSVERKAAIADPTTLPASGPYCRIRNCSADVGNPISGVETESRTGGQRNSQIL